MNYLVAKGPSHNSNLVDELVKKRRTRDSKKKVRVE